MKFECEREFEKLIFILWCVCSLPRSQPVCCTHVGHSAGLPEAELILKVKPWPIRTRI